ncbi:MAG: reverse transcriptase family protein [Verrucomicrobiales bacterium]
MLPQSEIQSVAEALAATFLAGEFAPGPMVRRAGKHYAKSWSGLEPLCQRLAEAFGPSTRPAQRDLIAAISGDQALIRWLRAGGMAKFRTDIGTRPTMRGAKGNPSRWNLPEITSSSELSRWLNLTQPELEWFAHPWGKAPGPQHHYRYHWLEKRRGGHRLIEQPKKALKLLQQRILKHILDQIPPHGAVHSFRTGRNVISYAQPHCDRPVLLRLDIADFFPSLHVGRVRALFRTAGYPDAVANLLADLCCHATPATTLTDAPTALNWSQMKRLRSPHLPQGAPTSPALSNLLAYRLDCRLAGLARAIGARYTRYADDLAFSGDRSVAKIAPRVGAILIEQGFSPNHRKTRLQRRGSRQRLGGTIVNSPRPNFERSEFDQLKAILHNCVQNGPQAEDRQQLGSAGLRAKLRGKISWVQSLNPQRAEKLERLFEQISW